MRPIIGITCNFREAKLGTVGVTGVVGQDFFVSAADYIDRVEQAGGIPIILPVSEDPEVIGQYIALCDGILVAGGNDVHPREYGEEDRSCGITVEKRDKFDIQLIKGLFTATDKPLLGICRGCQILNVALGGTLCQDLETAGYPAHTFPDVQRNQLTHTVHIAEDSKLYQCLGAQCVGVNSYHHQAIARLAPGASCTAKAPDGVMESIEFPGERFFLGVQWHPEMMYDSEDSAKLFRAFVAAAAAQRAKECAYV